jgi:hypothetical protein
MMVLVSTKYVSSLTFPHLILPYRKAWEEGCHTLALRLQNAQTLLAVVKDGLLLDKMLVRCAQMKTKERI